MYKTNEQATFALNQHYMMGSAESNVSGSATVVRTITIRGKS